MKIEHDIEFDFEQLVYLKTDKNQMERMVTGITLRPGGAVIYELTCGTECTPHYSFEITSEKDIIKATS